MARIFVNLPLSVRWQERLEEEAARFGDTLLTSENGTADEDLLDSADAFIGFPNPKDLRGRTNLRWVQLGSSGADAPAAAVPDTTVLTSATGAYGMAISEYLVGMLLVMMKRIPAYLENQKKRLWKDEGLVETPAGKRILVVGTGDIGRNFAKRIRAFGTDLDPVVLSGIRRRAAALPEFDEIHTTEELPSELGKADVVVLCLPQSDATQHLIGRDALLSCKEGAYLMNVGRGSAIDTEALRDDAVRNRFAGIYLDVTEQEPLPSESPLYGMENVFLTPHITGGSHLQQTSDLIAKITMHNYRAFHGEGAYISVVDHRTGYCQ